MIQEEVKDKWLQVKMPDDSLWAVPVMIIAMNRAEYYKHEFDNDVQKSLKEDTLPLFAESDYDIKDWAAGNMNWDDVKHYAIELETIKPEVDYQDGWVEGEQTILKFKPKGKNI